MASVTLALPIFSSIVITKAIIIDVVVILIIVLTVSKTNTAHVSQTRQVLFVSINYLHVSCENIAYSIPEAHLKETTF